HPAHPLEATLAELLVEVRDHLDVALAAERVPARTELGAQLSVVVELAVADADDVAGFVLDRLLAGVEVDDRQPAHREREPDEGAAPLGVGPAMAQQLDRIERRRRPVGREQSEDPAHSMIVAEAAGRAL